MKILVVGDCESEWLERGSDILRGNDGKHWMKVVKKLETRSCGEMAVIATKRDD
jgi:hypothetical protein